MVPGVFFSVQSDTSLMVGHIIIIISTLALGINIIKILNVRPGSLSGWCSGKHADCVQRDWVRSPLGRYFLVIFFHSAKDIWAIYFEMHPYLRFSFKMLFMFKVRVRTTFWVSVNIINWSSERVWTLINDESEHQRGVRLSTEKNLQRRHCLLASWQCFPYSRNGRFCCIFLIFSVLYYCSPKHCKKTRKAAY